MSAVDGNAEEINTVNESASMVPDPYLSNEPISRARSQHPAPRGKATALWVWNDGAKEGSEQCQTKLLFTIDLGAPSLRSCGPS